MRKYLFLMLVVVLLIVMPTVAMAADEGALLTDYMTPEQFMTFAGQVTFVLLFVQFFKLTADRLIGGHVKTEYVVYVVSIIARVLAQWLTKGAAGFTLEFIPSCMFEAFLVSVAAMKTFETAVANVEDKAAAIKMARDVVMQMPPVSPPNSEDEQYIGT